MAGRPLRRARLNRGARTNPVEQKLPPGDYTWMDEDSGLNMDENYEMAMSEDGVYAYKIIGHVMKRGSPQSKQMWKLAVNNRITPEIVARFVSLPDGFWPESTLVGVGYDGTAYNVYLLNEEDVAMRSLSKGIPTAAGAEAFATVVLAKAQAPKVAANNPAPPGLKSKLRGEQLNARLQPWVGRRVSYKADPYITNKYGPQADTTGVVVRAYWGPEYQGDDTGSPQLVVAVDPDAHGNSHTEQVVGDPAQKNMFPGVTLL